jgi:hypothetical protein
LLRSEIETNKAVATAAYDKLFSKYDDLLSKHYDVINAKSGQDRSNAEEKKRLAEEKKLLENEKRQVIPYKPKPIRPWLSSADLWIERYIKRDILRNRDI